LGEVSCYSFRLEGAGRGLSRGKTIVTEKEFCNKRGMPLDHVKGARQRIMRGNGNPRARTK